MDLLERYLKQIERYLPLNDRKETLKELRGLILDQVDEMNDGTISEETLLYNTIKDMGEPRDVASKYNDKGPFISKEMEPIMMMVLKIVSFTLPAVVLFGNAIDYIFSTATFDVMGFFLDIAYNIPNAIYALLVGYGFIFIFFYFIERFIQPKFEVEHKEFYPELLPKVPQKAYKVSLVESIFTVLATVLALYLFNLQSGLIAIYSGTDRVPLLNENFERMLPFINIGWFASIIVHIFYLFKRKKSLPSKTIELLLGIYGGAIAILLGTSDIFNPVVIEGNDLFFIPTAFKVVMILAGIGGIIGHIVEYVKLLINLDALEDVTVKIKKKEQEQ